MASGPTGGAFSALSTPRGGSWQERPAALDSKRLAPLAHCCPQVTPHDDDPQWCCGVAQVRRRDRLPEHRIVVRVDLRDLDARAGLLAQDDDVARAVSAIGNSTPRFVWRLRGHCHNAGRASRRASSDRLGPVELTNVRCLGCLVPSAGPPPRSWHLRPVRPCADGDKQNFRQVA